MTPKHPPGPPMNLANTREQGVTALSPAPLLVAMF